MTKADRVKWVKGLWAEAWAADPVHVQEVVEALFKREVFVWDNLTVAELGALGRRLLGVVLRARG